MKTQEAERERWERAKELWQAALDRDPQERTSFLAEACHGDEELRLELLSLVRSHDEAGGFLEGEPPALEDCDEPPDALVGRYLGPYRLTSVIGRGGMGVVYDAVRADTTYEKRVAIKVVKRGTDTDVVLRCFRAERQILARLEHPCIARLLDAGSTPDGRPYFVLEMVDGLRLDQWIRQRAGDLRQRLELFLKICGAVQYAHQNLVVHRDLKPGNVLVTPEGEPKLLDFGIAKALHAEDGGDTTATALRLMTPDYASPEQVRGEPVTTATDVHALGLILYEMLTGCRTYRATGGDPGDVAYRICHLEPERPSVVAGREALREVDPRAPTAPLLKAARLRRKALAGDLDTIVMMALRKEPWRRYASVDQLADDVCRHLEGLPVRARKDTAWYRAGKFIRRHRLGLGAAVAVALTLTWSYASTRAERGRAERRFQDVRHLANSLVFEIHDEIAALPGSTNARRRIVQEALAYLDRLSAETAGDEPLQRELAAAYAKLGAVQGAPGASNLGDVPGALSSYGKAVALYAAGGAPRSLEAKVGLAESHFWIGRLRESRGEFDAALASLQEARQWAEAAAGEAPQDAIHEARLVRIDTRRGVAFRSAVRNTQALAALNSAVDRAALVLLRAPGSAEMSEGLADAYEELGYTRMASGQYVVALDMYAKARPIREARLAAAALSVPVRRALAKVHFQTGSVLLRIERWNDAVVSLREAAAMFQTIATADPVDFDARHMLGFVESRLCLAQARAEQRAEARRTCQQAVSHTESLAQDFPDSIEAQRRAGDAQSTFGEAQRTLGDPRQALHAFQRSLAHYEAIQRDHPAHPGAPHWVGFGHMRVADAYATLGDVEQAIVAYRTAARCFEPLITRDPDAELLGRLARIYQESGVLLERQATAGPAAKRFEHWRAARAAYEQALGIRDRLPLDPEDKVGRRQLESLRSGLQRCDTALRPRQ